MEKIRTFAATINAGFMSTLTIQVDNPAILASLKRILNAMEGVSIVKSTKRSRSKKLDITQTSGYKEAMDDKEKGRVYHADNVDDMFNQILG